MADAPHTFFLQLPVITRTYVSVCFLTTLATQLEILSPFKLYFNSALIYNKLELWRIVTNFFYFGPFNIEYVFHMYFLYRYSLLLEQDHFLGRTADYLFMLLFGATLILCMAPFLDMYFLGMGLTSMLVYVWSRRNPNVHMSILGILTFKAPYLPWVLLLFSLMLNQSIMVDIIGIATGHIYYFLEDVYPARTGTRLLRTPRLLTWLFQEAPPALDADGVPLPQVDAAPGGFAWGQGRPVGAEAQ